MGETPGWELLPEERGAAPPLHPTPQVGGPLGLASCPDPPESPGLAALFPDSRKAFLATSKGSESPLNP